MGIFKSKYERALDKSAGLEKIRLLVRGSGITIDHDLWSGAGSSKNPITLMGVVTLSMLFADAFYNTLNTLFKKAGASTDEMFGRLADDLYENFDKRDVISSRLYGIAFAIYLHNIAANSNMAVNEKEVIELIESGKVKDELKKEIKDSFSLMLGYYNDPIVQTMGMHGAMPSRELGALAYSLVDNKLGEGHYADPLYTMAAATAEAMASRYRTIGNDTEWLVEAGFIG